MGKQRKKTRDDAKVGTGKVTSTQVAFMVECYLRDQQFTKTLTLFRDEASTLLSPFKSVPKSLMSLSTILNEYITLKEEQLAVAEDKARMDRFFRGLQDMVGAYQAGSLPAWLPSTQGSFNIPTLATPASTISASVSGLPCKTASMIQVNNPRSINNLQQSSIQEESLKKRKIHALSMDKQAGNVHGAAQYKKARLSSAGDLAKIQAQGVMSYSNTQEVQALKHLQPSTPPVQQCPTMQNLISCDDNRSELTRTPCVVTDLKYSYANNSPVYTSNATSLPKNSANIELVKGKKQSSKCRTLDFETPITSSNSDPCLPTELAADKTIQSSEEDVFCRTSSDLTDSFLEDFLNSEAVTPEDMSALDDILADLGDISFSELLGGAMPDLVPQKLPNPAPIHETRVVNNDKVCNSELTVQRKHVGVLAQLTHEEINRQDFTNGRQFSDSPKKKQQTYTGEKAKELAGKENMSISGQREKKAASSLRRL